MDETPPNPSLVASQSRDEADKQHAIDSLEYSLREMTANLLRVIRGAGRPYALFQEIINVSEEILELSKTARPFEFVPQLEEALREGVPRHADLDDMDEYMTLVVRGSLQLTASRIRRQLTQERRGHSEVIDGIRLHEELVEERRKRRAAEAKATSPRRAPQVRRKPKRLAVKAAPEAKPPKPIEARKRPGESTADFMRRLSEGVVKPKG